MLALTSVIIPPAVAAAPTVITTSVAATTTTTAPTVVVTATAATTTAPTKVRVNALINHFLGACNGLLVSCNFNRFLTASIIIP